MLSPGDIVVHTVVHEIGVLIDRFNVLEDTERPLWAWNIWWNGSEAQTPRQCGAYTEEGLLILIKDGIFIHYKNS